MQPLSTVLAIAAALIWGNAGVLAQQYSTGWNFSWPDTTQQCQNVTIAISGGQPPWIVGLIPIGGSPITWRVRQPEDGSNATLESPVTASIPIQMPAGTRYSVLVTDQIGYAGAGGVSVINPTVLQRVGESTDASCLSDINAIPQEFNFQAYGDAAACGNGFKLAWQDQVGRSPYSMTVVPLDTAYNPWDVPLSGGVIQPDYVWSPNMTAGTYFTLILTNQNGWGRGGVGQVYRVTNGTGPESCVTQPYLGRLPIVGAVNIDTALPASASFTTTIAPASAGQTSTTVPNQDAATTSATASASVITGKVPPIGDDTDGSDNSSSNGHGNGRKEASGTNVAAIAGGVAGGVVALAAAGLLVWFCMRRRKRNTIDKDGYQYSPPADIDGNGHMGNSTMVGKVEPFPTTSNSGLGQNRMSIVPEMSYAQHQPGTTLSHHMPIDTPYAPYDNRDSMPMPFPTPIPSRRRDSYAPPSQTGGSSDQGYDYGSSPSGPAGFGAATAGAGAGAGAFGTAGGSGAAGSSESGGPHDNNPYGTLKAALPPTFTSPRESYPTGPPPGAGSSGSSDMAAGMAAPASAASPLHSGPGSPGSHGPASPPILSSGAVASGSDHRASSSFLSNGQVNPHQEYNFIRHSDGGAVSPQAEGAGGAETVELPPEYDDRRATAQ